MVQSNTWRAAALSEPNSRSAAAAAAPGAAAAARSHCSSAPLLRRAPASASSASASTAALAKIRQLEAEIDREVLIRRETEGRIAAAAASGGRAAAGQPPQPPRPAGSVPLTEANLRLVGRCPLVQAALPAPYPLSAPSKVPSSDAVGSGDQQQRRSSQRSQQRQPPQTADGAARRLPPVSYAPAPPAFLRSSFTATGASSGASRKPPVYRGHIRRGGDRLHSKLRPDDSAVWVHRRRQEANELRFLFRDNWA